MHTQTRLAAALVTALIVGFAAMKYDGASGTPPTVALEIGSFRALLLGLAAGLALLAATGLRRLPRPGRLRRSR